MAKCAKFDVMPADAGIS